MEAAGRALPGSSKLAAMVHANIVLSILGVMQGVQIFRSANARWAIMDSTALHAWLAQQENTSRRMAPPRARTVVRENI